MPNGKTNTSGRRLRWGTYGSWADTAVAGGTCPSTRYAAIWAGVGQKRATARLFKEQRERGREERPTRSARLHRPGGGEQQRDGEGRGVDVPHVDPLQRRARQVEQREGGGRPLVPEPGPRA